MMVILLSCADGGYFTLETIKGCSYDFCLSRGDNNHLDSNDVSYYSDPIRYIKQRTLKSRCFQAR